jgi:PKD repeat protein
MPSSLRPISKPRHAVFLLATLALATTLICTVAARAHASEGSQYGSIGQYGETTRTGGFDSGWFDEGKYDGGGKETAPTPGEFIDPVGFAVDAQDKTAGGNGTAVYVLDRVSGITTASAPAQGTRWRLQKLAQQSDGTLTVAAITEFFLPNTGVTNGTFASTGTEYLAIDDVTKTIYALLYKLDGSGDPYVDEVLGWSTEPSGGKLVGSTGTADKVSTPVSGYGSATVISSSSQISGADLYDPQGIALDGTGELAIAAQSSYNGGEPQGPVVVQQVAEQTGALGSSWTSSGLDSATNASANEEALPAEGIFDAGAGTLDLVLARAEFGRDADIVQLDDSLSDPKILASESLEQEPGGLLISLDAQVFERKTTASPVVALSNGLYATSYKGNAGNYWNGIHNDAVQLLQPETGGLLSNSAPPLSSVFDTLGNASGSTGACSINNPTRHPDNVVLASGANGAVWILTQGQGSTLFGGTEESSFTYGRQLIEYSPGAANPCVGPSGTFSLNKEGEPQNAQPASSPLTVPVGSTIEFDGATIAYPDEGENPEAAIYAYEWAPTGTANGYTIVNDSPVLPTASYKYETPGVYPVALKLLGDFGEYDETGTVVVQATSPPTAAFTAPSSVQTGVAASFNASGSAHASGTSIADYHWSFGDGQSDDKQSATDSHTYSSAGTYTVTLTVRDSDEQKAVVSHQITVTSPPVEVAPPTTTPTTSTPPPPPPAVDRSATNVSPKATEVKGSLAIALSCPATKVSCAGTVTAKTASAVAARKPKKAVLTLGAATFTLTPGAKRTVTIKLSAKGAALLKKDGSLKVIVIVAAHDSYGDPLTRTLTLTLREPAKKKAAHKK